MIGLINTENFIKILRHLTGGIGITFGIIFSGIFLFFLADDPSYTSEISSKELFRTRTKKFMKLKYLNNEKEILVKKIDDDSFSITLTRWYKKIYEISDSNESVLISTSK